MALFFDGEWFDARLAAHDLSRRDIAHALGIGEDELALVWKDQRELSAREVSMLAAMLDATAPEIARHAGVSTPVPPANPNDSRTRGETLADISDRLGRLERAIADVKALILDLRKRP